MGEKKTKGREARKRERERKYKRLFIKGQRKVESCQGLNFISLMQKTPRAAAAGGKHASQRAAEYFAVIYEALSALSW